MKKIPTLLLRNPDDRAHVLDQVTPGCEWVLAGAGVATRKLDGTCMMFDENARWWARREVKSGATRPVGFLEVEYDEVTHKTFGWVPVEYSPFIKFHQEAVKNSIPTRQGTYELVGPKINGNPEKLGSHILVHHTTELRFEGFMPHTVEEIKDIVRSVGLFGWEGLVWQHPDGRMAKLKVRDLNV